MTPTDLVADLDRIAAVIGDLTGVNQLAATDVLAAVHPPVRTGALASTIEAVATDTGIDLIAGGSVAPYGPIVHARDPFFTRALTEREEAVIGLYLNHLQGAIA